MFRRAPYKSSIRDGTVRRYVVIPRTSATSAAPVVDTLESGAEGPNSVLQNTAIAPGSETPLNKKRKRKRK